MTMNDPNSIDATFISQLVSEHHSVQSVSDKLSALGLKEESILEYVSAFTKARNAKRQSTGLIYLVAGAFTGFVSCVLAIVNPIPELHNWFLFGLTSLAALSACYGLYNIFE